MHMTYIPFVSSIDVKVVVGSGVNDYIGDIEIYSQNNNSFQYGPVLPYTLHGAATVQYGDSLIVLGGVNGYCNCDNSGKIVITCNYYLFTINNIFCSKKFFI